MPNYNITKTLEGSPLTVHELLYMTGEPVVIFNKGGMLWSDKYNIHSVSAYGAYDNITIMHINTAEQQTLRYDIFNWYKPVEAKNQDTDTCDECGKKGDIKNRAENGHWVCDYCYSVNHPQHYGGDTTYEVIKVIEAWGLNFHTGNAVKYIARAGQKPGASELEDINKAIWYLERHRDGLS